MRTARLAVIALAGALLAGCNADITAPSSTPAANAPSLDGACRTGWLTSTGRCE